MLSTEELDRQWIILFDGWLICFAQNEQARQTWITMLLKVDRGHIGERAWMRSIDEKAIDVAFFKR